MLDDVRDEEMVDSFGAVAAQHQREPAHLCPTPHAIAHQAVVLEARWLEETWLNARRILSDHDPFLQALQLQRRTTAPVTPAAVRDRPMSLM